MAAANYPVTMVRGVMERTSRAYGHDHQFLALPNYVQVGSPTGEGMYIANPDFAVRFDQSFPLARLVARAPTGTVSPQITATLISMMSIAVGVQTGPLLWRAAIQMTSSPNRPAFHD
jgi:hypothetical protein